MVTGKFKFLVLILIVVSGINMISVQSFAAGTSSSIITTTDGYGFNMETGIITHYYGNGGDIEIPGQIYGTRVIGIGNSAFSDCTGLTAITIPNSVTSIGDYAFFECAGLTTINIPNSIISIGTYAFSACGFTDITIPSSVTSIGDYAFFECFGLTTINIPDSVTRIGELAFGDCTSLKNITFPGVTYLDGFVFQGCELESVTIPKSLKHYYFLAGSSGSGSPLSYCTINNLVFEDGTTDIRDEVFYLCDLKNITIPNSVTSIDQHISGYRRSLTIITYPGSSADEFAKSNNMTVKHLVPEDINGDMAVNMKDIILAASHFNTTSADSDYDIKCDLNNDKVINLIDIMMIAAKFNYVS